MLKHAADPYNTLVLYLDVLSCSCLVLRDDYGHDDDDQKNYDADDDAHPHLHILPPHLFPHPVGAAAESLGRDGQVVGLVLESVEPSATVGDFIDVLTHDADGVVNLSLDSGGPLVAATGRAAASAAIAGDVRVVGSLSHRSEQSSSDSSEEG